MTAAQRAMTTWVGELSRAGVIAPSQDAAAGEALAAYVVGAERLASLRSFFGRADAETLTRERRAAVEACIAMAQSDRDVHVEEGHILKQLVASSGLDEDAQDALVAHVHRSSGIEGLARRLTHPVLRELILALAWELALADGRIDGAETTFYRELARELEVDDARAAAIRDAVSERVS